MKIRLLGQASRCCPAAATLEHEASLTVFARALRTGNLVVAEGLARELGPISLAEALELKILIARKEPRRLQRVAVRWLERYLQECEPTLSDVALAISALATLAYEPLDEAIRVLRGPIGPF